MIDGLAFGVLPAAAASLHQRNPLIALVHQPLALESGLSLADANKFRASERAALEFARRVIATSSSTKNRLITDYGVPAEHIAVARPGSDPVAPAVGSRDGVVRLLAVGSVVPGKGYDVLIAALTTLTDLPWQLKIAGDTGRDRATAAKIEDDIARFKLTDRIALLGAVAPARLAELYRAADLFVLASRFESYGMAYAEAVAYGLPTIGTTAGAIPETLPGEIRHSSETRRCRGTRTRSSPADRRQQRTPEDFLCRACCRSATPDLARLRCTFRGRNRGDNKMSGFPPTCFHREPQNLRACTKVPAAVAAALAVLPALTIVDFACDTGSMLRALASHPLALQNGKLVDNDLDLLVRAADVFHPRPE